MLCFQTDENEYAIELYDDSVLHDDYIAGVVKRQPQKEDDTEWDGHYFMFHPQTIYPICAGDLRRISELCAKLNSTLGENTDAN